MNAEFINAGVFVDNISNVKFIIFHSVMAWTAHKKNHMLHIPNYPLLIQWQMPPGHNVRFLLLNIAGEKLGWENNLIKIHL